MTMYYFRELYVNPNVALLLDNCKFKDDNLVAGWVVNGAWYLRIKGEIMEAHYDTRSKKPVNSWSNEGIFEVHEVPREIEKSYCSWEYQPIMEAMEKHLGLNQGFTHSLTGKEN